MNTSRSLRCCRGGDSRHAAAENKTAPNPIGPWAGSRLIIDRPVLKAYRPQLPVERSGLSSRPDSDARGHRSCHRELGPPAKRRRKSRPGHQTGRAAVVQTRRGEN